MTPKPTGPFAIPSIIYDKVTEGWQEVLQEPEKRKPLNVVFTASEVEPAGISSSIFLFWFTTLLMKKHKNKIIKAFKILKQSITPAKAGFPDYI